MKVLFLDVDGVLNWAGTTDRRGADGYPNVYGMELEKVRMLEDIVKQTGVEVVLSSTWRYSPDWRNDMKRNGIQQFEFLDRTPMNNGLTSRGTEVKQWLDAHPEVKKFACLDDATDFLEGQKLFQTKWDDQGLTRKIADDIIAYFNA